MPNFFSLKGSTALIKNGGQRTRFYGRAAESVHQTHFLRFLREDWDRFQNDMYVEGRKKH